LEVGSRKTGDESKEMRECGLGRVKIERENEMKYEL